jgi:hypothetical protein
MSESSSVLPPSPTDASTPDARLVVLRNAADDVRQREVLVFVDGVRVGTLTYGRKIVRAIPAGRRRLRVYNTLVSRSCEFDIAEGETVTFVTGNRAAGCLLGWLMVIGAGPLTVFLTRVEDGAGHGMREPGGVQIL